MLSNVYLISILGKTVKSSLHIINWIQVELLLSDLTYMDNVYTDIPLHFHGAFIDH